MIHASKRPLVLAVLLSFAAASASAEVCGASASAMSQLAAAAPGGAQALEAIVVGTPTPRLSSRGGLYDAAAYDTTRADKLLAGLAASARKTGKTKAADLFIRLLNEGTPAEKLQFMHTTGKPYSFPSRFTLAVAAGGSCRMVSEIVCWTECVGTDATHYSCREVCKIVSVEVCD